MAGDWIKMELATPDKPEVLAISSALQIPREQVLGCLFMIWAWFDQQTVDGNACVTLASLSRHAGITGFAEAMVEVGWLSTGAKDGKTIVTMTAFSLHNGKSAKERALSAKRASRFRNAHVTPASRSQRDQEKSIYNPPTPQGDPRRKVKGNGKQQHGAWWLSNDSILAKAKELSINTQGETAEALKAAIRLKLYPTAQAPEEPNHNKFADPQE